MYMGKETFIQNRRTKKVKSGPFSLAWNQQEKLVNQHYTNQNTIIEQTSP
jgi:hypothetical protein